MTRPLRNLISAVTLAALTGLLVLAATQWTDVFFRFYPSFSRWILGVLTELRGGGRRAPDRRPAPYFPK